MGSMTEILAADAPAEFFAPCSTDLIDGLIAQYRGMRTRIEQIGAMVTGETAGAMSYFLEGNQDRANRCGSPSVERLFDVKGALAALNSAYWSKAMQLTDVLDYMPQARREEWRKSISEQSCPPFEESTVRDTLLDLLNKRGQFLAERVDGIFRNLSGEHVTNSPAAFGKRMILAGITNSYYCTERVGYINDLRAVIAKFMGRDDPKWNASAEIVSAARHRHGEWVTIDGGALRLRCYLKGTAHLEVHPDIAWRLNQILASLYPRAIPPEFRTKPKKAHKEFQMIGRPLPFAVISALTDLEPATRLEKNTGPDHWRCEYTRIKIANSVQFRYSCDHDKAVRAEAERVLAYIGGVKVTNDRGGSFYQFDYDPSDVLTEIVCSGCIPDQKAHQFYPTPDLVAKVAVEMAQIGETDTVLEPSAGQGDLAGLLPSDQTTCVEISPLHCAILKARGFNTIEADFLKWAATAPQFDRVVMNPPFSEGRALAHVEAASTLVKRGGRLVAILPASFKGKDVLPGWAVEWSRVFDNEFAGTSVSVVILLAEAAA